MAQLIELVHAYEKLKKDQLQKRALLVLEMIERIITFPPVETITATDIARVDVYIEELIQDLRRDKQYLFSVRIGKIWNKREQLLQLGKTWHEIQKDYIDEIEYHQEIKWLRDQRRRILNLM